MSTRAEFRARAASRDQRLLTGLRRRLGHAGVIGGLAQAERIAYGDDTLRVLLDLSPAGRKEAFALIARLVENARLQPPLLVPPSPDRRVKVHWTEDVIARFKAELPRAQNDIDLAARLGLPAYCRGAMRAARSRYARQGFRVGVDGSPARQPRQQPTMPLAA